MDPSESQVLGMAVLSLMNLLITLSLPRHKNGFPQLCFLGQLYVALGGYLKPPGISLLRLPQTSDTHMMGVATLSLTVLPKVFCDS